MALFDVYEGAQVGPGRKSLAYSLLYQADDRTLTDAEVNRAHADVVERLRAELGAEVRGADGAGGAAAEGGRRDDATTSRLAWPSSRSTSSARSS